MKTLKQRHFQLIHTLSKRRAQFMEYILSRNFGLMRPHVYPHRHFMLVHLLTDSQPNSTANAGTFYKDSYTDRPHYVQLTTHFYIVISSSYPNYSRHAPHAPNARAHPTYSRVGHHAPNARVHPTYSRHGHHAPNAEAHPTYSRHGNRVPNARAHRTKNTTPHGNHMIAIIQMPFDRGRV